ncbi:MAG: signal peptidase I [Verrucomicrobiia bacterium]
MNPTLRRLLLTLAAVWLVRKWVLCPLLITGASMEPTLHHCQFGFVNILAFVFYPPRRGDVVVLRTGKELVVKRVIGVPGEEIGVHQGVFIIDGQPLAEAYVNVHCSLNIASSRLGPDQFVVAGDNRAETYIAVADRRRIMGKLVLWRDLLAGNPPGRPSLSEPSNVKNTTFVGIDAEEEVNLQ